MTTRDSSKQATHEAAAWVLELQEGEVSKSDRERFARWLRESPANVREYLELAGLWSELEAFDADRRIDVDALLEDDNVVPLVAGRDVGDATPATKPPVRWVQWAAAGVAIAAIAVGATFGWQFLQAPGADIVTTRIGEQRSVALEDGSVLHLNTDSSAAIVLDDASRFVELHRGEAFFTVAKDPKRPFVVRAGETEVRAIGTQFNVRRRDASATVTVVEGRVAVMQAAVAAPYPGASAEAAISPVELSAGQQLRLDSGGGDIRTEQVKTEKVVAWTERRLVFEGETLANIVAEFNRYNLNRLEVTDPAIASIELSAVFGSNDPDSLLEYLTTVEAVEVERRADGTRVIRAAPVH